MRVIRQKPPGRLRLRRGDDAQVMTRLTLADCLGALAAAILTFALWTVPALSGGEQAKPVQGLEGRLLAVPGAGPVLKTPTKDYPLAGKTSYLFHTLQDKRLLNRGVRLDGVVRPDGTFEVERLFTVRDGKLFRVRYYCEICNIEALEPGNCVCCQQPTELQEIPVPEAK